MRRNPVRWMLMAWTLMACWADLAVAAEEEARYRDRRTALVRELRAEDLGSGDPRDPPRLSERVLEAIGTVPRHRFVPESERDAAYANRPLPIGYGQTISQPYIVALMTELLRPEAHHRVLEIGTGSGYQAAVLHDLVAQVVSLEIVPPLAASARKRLRELGYSRIEVHEADGYYGWPQAAPFDAIIVTAAAPSVPPPLLQQLRPGGRMVIPVGAPFLTQRLLLIEKHRDGRVVTRNVLPVVFVPLTGAH